MDNLIRRAKAEKPVDGHWIEFLGRAVPFIKFARESRNGVEHPQPGKRVIVRDFELDKEARLITPSIEIVLPKSSEPRVSLVVFMREMVSSLAALYAEMIANLCARKAAIGGFEVAVVKQPEDRRQFKALEYAYAIYLNGEWQPIG